MTLPSRRRAEDPDFQWLNKNKRSKGRTKSTTSPRRRNSDEDEIMAAADALMLLSRRNADNADISPPESTRPPPPPPPPRNYHEDEAFATEALILLYQGALILSPNSTPPVINNTKKTSETSSAQISREESTPPSPALIVTRARSFRSDDVNHAVSEKNFECDVCHKRLTSAKGLSNHKRKHKPGTSARNAAADPRNRVMNVPEPVQRRLKFDLNSEPGREAGPH